MVSVYVILIRDEGPGAGPSLELAGWPLLLKDPGDTMVNNDPIKAALFLDIKPAMAASILARLQEPMRGRTNDLTIGDSYPRLGPERMASLVSALFPLFRQEPAETMTSPPTPLRGVVFSHPNRGYGSHIQTPFLRSQSVRANSLKSRHS